MTDDLIAWRRAQLDEDERVARAAAKHGPSWEFVSGSLYPSDEARHPGAFATGAWGELEDELGEHIARHDPDRALAEVDSQRRILDAYEAALAEADDDPNDPARGADASTLEWVVKTLALPSADRYRDEWKP